MGLHVSCVLRACRSKCINKLISECSLQRGHRSVFSVEVRGLLGAAPRLLQLLLSSPLFSVLSDLWKGLQTKACLLQRDLHGEGELRV